MAKSHEKSYIAPTIKYLNDRLTETILAINKRFSGLADDINAVPTRIKKKYTSIWEKIKFRNKN